MTASQSFIEPLFLSGEDLFGECLQLVAGVRFWVVPFPEVTQVFELVCVINRQTIVEVKGD